MSQIHISRDRVEWGPYALEQVNQMLASRQLDPGDLAWTEGMADWQPLAQFPGVIAPPPAAEASPSMPHLTQPGQNPAHVVTRIVRAGPAVSYASAYQPGAGIPVTSGAAVTSLIFGILALLICWFPFLGVPMAIVAIVCGHVGRGGVRKSRGTLTGGGMALAGLITGYLAIILPVTVLIFAFNRLGKAVDTVRSSQADSTEALVELRRNFATTLIRQERESMAAEESRDDHMKLIRYEAPDGMMVGYVSTNSKGPERLPALIWLPGGFSNSVMRGMWHPGPPENDQSASSFQDPNLVILYPSMRGGNQNTGVKEGLFGEVEDVGAAVKWLSAQPGVDPKRIYVGGHSTGGTLALLVAETVPGLRAVFSFGPVAQVSDYGQEYLPYKVTDWQESRLRSPLKWLHLITCPTFIMEGTEGNIDSLRQLKRINSNRLLTFYELDGHDHFSGLQPMSRQLLTLILNDTAETVSLPLKPDTRPSKAKPRN